MVNFKTALILMKMGEKVKRHSWASGYWMMIGNEIFIKTENGDIINLRKANNMYGILLNISNDDWEVVEKVVEKPIKNSTNTDWDGDKTPFCDKSYSLKDEKKQKDLYEKALKNYYKKILEKRALEEKKKTREEKIKIKDYLEFKRQADEIQKELDTLWKPKKNEKFSKLESKKELQDYMGNHSDNKKEENKKVTYDSLMDEIKKDFDISIEDENKKIPAKEDDHHEFSRVAPDVKPSSDNEFSHFQRRLSNRIDNLNRKNKKEETKSPNFSFKHGKLASTGEKKQETSNDRLKEATKKASDYPRVAPNVKPSNDYTEEDFKYLYKLFESLYKDGTLEKVTNECLEQMSQDLLSLKKTLNDILDKNKSKKED